MKKQQQKTRKLVVKELNPKVKTLNIYLWLAS